MDIVRRSLVSLVCSLVIAYAVYLLTIGATVVSPEYVGMNFIGILMLIAIAGYVGIIYGVYPIYHPRQKRIFLILGIALIFIGQSIFINDINTNVYAADITKIFGVLIVWFGATGLLSKTKAIKEGKRKSKKMEIIEA